MGGLNPQPQSWGWEPDGFQEVLGWLHILRSEGPGLSLLDGTMISYVNCFPIVCFGIQECHGRLTGMLWNVPGGLLPAKLGVTILNCSIQDGNSQQKRARVRDHGKFGSVSGGLLPALTILKCTIHTTGKTL